MKQGRERRSRLRTSQAPATESTVPLQYESFFAVT